MGVSKCGTSLFNELREAGWLAAVALGLSTLGVAFAVAMAILII